MARSLVVTSIVAASLVVGASARAERPKILVLPLASTSSVDADVARAFDARLLVALDDTGKVTTMTPADEPECTSLTCLAELGTSLDAAYVLSMSVVREDDGLTLFATVVESKTGSTSRRAELVSLAAADLAKTAPAEVARRLLGAAGGAAVLAVQRPGSGVPRSAALSLIDKLAVLGTFTVLPLDGNADRSTVTHRAEISIRDFAIVKRRHHIHRYLDGVLIGTLSITDLSDGRAVFTKTVKVTESRRARYATTAEVTAILIQDAVDDWMTAFRAADVETRLKGEPRP